MAVEVNMLFPTESQPQSWRRMDDMMWKNRDEGSARSAAGPLLTAPSRIALLIFTQTSSGLFQGTFFQHYCCKGQNICSVWGVTPKYRHSDPQQRYLGFGGWTPTTSPVQRHASRPDPSVVQNRPTNTYTSSGLDPVKLPTLPTR